MDSERSGSRPGMRSLLRQVQAGSASLPPRRTRQEKRLTRPLARAKAVQNEMERVKKEKLISPIPEEIPGRSRSHAGAPA